MISTFSDTRGYNLQFWTEMQINNAAFTPPPLGRGV